MIKNTQSYAIGRTHSISLQKKMIPETRKKGQRLHNGCYLPMAETGLYTNCHVQGEPKCRLYQGRNKGPNFPPSYSIRSLQINKTSKRLVFLVQQTTLGSQQFQIDRQTGLSTDRPIHVKKKIPLRKRKKKIPQFMVLVTQSFCAQGRPGKFTSRETSCIKNLNCKILKFPVFQYDMVFFISCYLFSFLQEKS